VLTLSFYVTGVSSSTVKKVNFGLLLCSWDHFVCSDFPSPILFESCSKTNGHRSRMSSAW